MLDQNIIEQLRTIFAGLRGHISFRMSARPADTTAPEMLEFLQEVASTSPHLAVATSEADEEAPFFEIIRDGTPTGVRFRGIPNGHEFSTLLLAVLNADGQGKNLPDDTLRSRITALKGPVRLRSLWSRPCESGEWRRLRLIRRRCWRWHLPGKRRRSVLRRPQGRYPPGRSIHMQLLSLTRKRF